MTPPISETLVERVARAVCGRDLAYRDCERACLAAGKCVGKLNEYQLSDARAAIEAMPRNDERKLVEAAQRALNYIENTEGELGITLECGDALRTALADFQPTNGEA